LKGAVPLDTPNVAEYTTPTRPAGKLAGLIAIVFGAVKLAVTE
jgi:hypothetical protein